MENTVDIKRVQMRLLEMAKAIAKILEENQIRYFIAYGTLLGAVRHKGFIPWDDDFDFYLFDDEYSKAMSLLRSKLPAGMFLEDADSEPLYFHAWAHVKDEHSKASCLQYPHDSFYQHQGISVDLYCIKEMKEYELSHYLNEENRKYIERRKSKNLITLDDYENRMKKLLADEAQETCDKTKQRTIYGFVSSYKCKYFIPDIIFPLKKYSFEDCEFFGPNDGDAYLHSTYGDYMQLPPVEQRHCHYDKVEFFD